MMAHSGEKALTAENGQEAIYEAVRGYVVAARKQIYVAVNGAMVDAYWHIGRQLNSVVGENGRATYGKRLLKYLAAKLTAEFGRGFDESNLRNMLRFYRAFPIQDALRPELIWTHYRLLMKVPDERAREFYAQEAVKASWSTRQLERQINTLYYHRILASRDKEGVAAEIQLKEPRPEYESIIKDVTVQPVPKNGK